jgi:hypothetical protein
MPSNGSPTSDSPRKHVGETSSTNNDGLKCPSCQGLALATQDAVVPRCLTRDDGTDAAWVAPQVAALLAR